MKISIMTRKAYIENVLNVVATNGKYTGRMLAVEFVDTVSGKNETREFGLRSEEEEINTMIKIGEALDIAHSLTDATAVFINTITNTVIVNTAEGIILKEELSANGREVKTVKQRVIEEAIDLRYNKGLATWEELKEALWLKFSGTDIDIDLINIETVKVGIEEHFKEQHRKLTERGYNKPYIPRDYYRSVLEVIDLLAYGIEPNEAITTVHKRRKNEGKEEAVNPFRLEELVEEQLKHVEITIEEERANLAGGENR